MIELKRTSSRCVHGFERSVVRCRPCDSRERAVLHANREQAPEGPPVRVNWPRKPRVSPGRFTRPQLRSSPIPPEHAITLSQNPERIQPVQIEETPEPEARKPWRSDRYGDFIDFCCRALEVERSEILSIDKSVPHILQARQFIAWALRDRWNLSYPHLGRLLQRDHTTMRSSVRKVSNALEARERWALECVAACEVVPSQTIEIEAPLDSLRWCGETSALELDIAFDPDALQLAVSL